MSQGQDVCIAWREVREDEPRSGAAYGALGRFLSRQGRAKGIIVSVQREMSRKRQNFLECVNHASTLAWRAGKEKCSRHKVKLGGESETDTVLTGGVCVCAP